MKSVIALVGRPNVGKSTLFNRLTKSRDALVANFPGLTRDRNYGIGKVGSRPYIVVDTGGLSSENDEIFKLMAGQVHQSVTESDIILLLVDGRAGLSAADETIVERLRHYGKPLVLVVNKVEGLNKAIASAEFQSLGLSPFEAISAEHGEGVIHLMDTVLSLLPELDAQKDEAVEKRINIAIVGRPNVGKSTLVNQLLGEERVLTYDQPGTTRDSIFIPFERKNKQYTLIDTAGLRRRSKVIEVVEKFSAIKTLQAIDVAHVVVLMLDAQQGVSDQDAKILGGVLDSGRALVIAVNKWDGLKSDEKTRIKKELDRKLTFIDFARVHFISALRGTGIRTLFSSIDKAYHSATRKMTTPKLTRVLEEAVQQHAPPIVRGRRIKLRYAHQGGHTPPTVIIHGNQTQAVSKSYQRYLENYFRKAFKLEGSPIRLDFKSGENPYKGKKNVLTKRQMDKRKRLKKYIKKTRK